MAEKTSFMIQQVLKILLTLILSSASITAQATDSFQKFVKEFMDGYRQLSIPDFEYDYREYLKTIPSVSVIEQQQQFFEAEQKALLQFDRTKLSDNQNIQFAHLAYEIDFNLSRLSLEKDWRKADLPMPAAGIYSLPDHKNWYRYFVKKFTSTNITAEQLYALGTHEVQRVQNEIRVLRLALGFTDSLAFYKHLQTDSFYLTDKALIIRRFESIDSIVRTLLPSFIQSSSIPPVYAMEWSGATQFTPPGIYLNRSQNAYGKDVFQFNFWNGRYNRRAIEWLYMHEAVPGHHLQSSVRTRSELSDLFLYPGNFEGWGCYVEYLGKELGLYKDLYAYLGKWEWDLVRSVRVVLDVGIHYYGWTSEEALAYWRKNIPNQDDVALREITRVTNWCGQALSYKVGAHFIIQMKDDYLKKPGADVRSFHQRYLQLGNLPLEVARKHLLDNA